MEHTSTPAVTPVATGIRYGLFVGIIASILSFIQFAFIKDPETPFRWLSTVVCIIGIYMAHKQFKQSNSGFMSYGQGLGIGTILSVVAGLISGVFGYLYVAFIDPEYMNRAMEVQRAKMEAQGLDDAQIEQGMMWAQKFSTGPIVILFSLIIVVIIGFVISLIISAFTKNTRPEFE
ncbi:DUF4199 domain-containing protein [Hymenobacter perfusus]|uniref:DUF4199 domain-containing protein n=1 Tax=Hymenobacter perfusus TaxID=1236770 RepID=A0A428KCJ5_9BACT|nr:DUF4199 domain-containing protein [Hymenobacter perfusus]RSK44120.1 DUF4199 domain-containing protein [Hymenobacter perfusus]